MVIEKMMWEYIHRALTETEQLNIRIDKVMTLTTDMALDGEWRALFEYISAKYYEVASNRDFIYRESGVKGFFLAYLSMSPLYDTASEREIRGGYMDVVLNPNIRAYPEMLPDVWILEFKYVKKSEVSEAKLAQLRKEAEIQLEKYASKPRGGRPVRKIYIAATSDRILEMEEL
jgi:hypothetical protein